MAKIIIDKNLQTQIILPVDNIYERVLDNTITGNKSYEDVKDVPTIPTITQRYFTTLELQDDTGHTIPALKTYNYISDFTAQYRTRNELYSYDINLTYQEVE